MAIDADLHRCLEKQNLSLDDVPASGRSVPLKSITNLSRGGEQISVEDKIHPENYALCRRIARIMRLDVLGVDLLSPDLSQPWYSNGTAICEVNAQPQLGAGRTPVYWAFLQRYLRPAIPITLTVRAGAAERTPVLYDPADQELRLVLSARELLAEGCPVQYFDKLEIAGDVPAADRQRLERLLVSVPPAQS